jgi:GT2 family glycosyltransferase
MIRRFCHAAGPPRLHFPPIVRILFVATKSPFPPRDGGRLALWLTLQGLAAAGHQLTLVAPVEQSPSAADLAALSEVCEPHLVTVRATGRLRSAFEALWRGQAWSIVRHHHVAVEEAVDACLESWKPDLVHAEQLQAFANCAPATCRGVPIVLRMQNVESALWEQSARVRRGAWLWRREAKALRAAEARAIQTCARCIALTARDALALRELSATPQNHVVAIAPPFPRELPAAPAVEGEPAIALAGSAGWWPNRDGLHWFLREVAPRLRDANARIHVYGDTQGATCVGLVAHPAPTDARDAFPANAIAAVPLHVGSGIRMRILEAWARGLPVVATPAAAAGLDVENSRVLLLAGSPDDFAAALGRVAAEPDLREALVTAGRDYLASNHDSGKLTEALTEQYASLRDVATTAAQPLIVVSVLNWNTPDRSLTCVRSLCASTYANFRVVLVDNASSDDSVARFRATLPNVVVLTADENRGFAAGHRLALAYAQQLGADALWLVNSDALAEPEALQNLVAAHREHGDAIYSGVPLRRARGSEIWLDFPEKCLDESARPRAFFRDAPIRFDAHWQHSPALRVGAVAGSSLYLPLSVVAAHGWLDESWFMHCEEIDYCYRLRAAGVARYLVPASRIWHESGGSSAGRLRVADVIAYYRARNEIRLAQIYASAATASLIALKKIVRAAAAWPRGSARSRCILRGARDGWHGVTGKTLSPDDYL